jgi:hypothetical protein
MGRIVLFVTSLTVLLGGSEALAGGRRQRLVERVHEAPAPPAVVRGRTPAAARDSGRYPKFTGGFHSRELQNIGVPTGDTGLRGNGFSMYPW